MRRRLPHSHPPRPAAPNAPRKETTRLTTQDTTTDLSPDTASPAHGVTADDA